MVGDVLAFAAGTYTTAQFATDVAPVTAKTTLVVPEILNPEVALNAF